MLATGGIGRAFKITSNSWEYTGDGHALAYHAGAELKDMEFVQFHPTGMVWPPSVRGILVTEGVRGEGGVLRNSEGKRFMFEDIPDHYKAQTADNEEEGWRYTQGDKNARRPPELLTRDHVARCINREVKAGRGSPHGGVFLDIAWIKKQIPNSEEHIKRKLPSMYHQFKQLADIDITKEPMEVGPDDALHDGRRPGGRRFADVDGAGFIRRRRSAPPGSTAPIDWAAIPSPICSCSASARASTRRRSRRSNGRPRLTKHQVAGRRGQGAGAVRARTGGENPYSIQHDLQDMMQDLVGIVRVEGEMQEALHVIGGLRERADRGRHRRQPSVQQRLAHGDGPATTADGVGGHRARRHRCARRAAARNSARTSRTKIRNGASSTSWFGRAPTARCSVARDPFPPMPAELQAGHRGEQVDGEAQTFRIWRGDAGGGAFEDYRTDGRSGAWWCSTPSIAFRPTQAPDLAVRWNCKAGKCGSCSAEINGMPKLMCMTRLNTLPLDKPVTVEPMHTFPLDARPGHGRLVELRGQEENQASSRRASPDAPDGTWRMQQEDIDRVQEFRKCIECFLCQDVCHVLRDHHKHDEFIGPRFFVYAAALEMHPLDTEDRVAELQERGRHRLLQHHQMLPKVCPESITITDNAIIPLKERVVDRYFDPLKKLFSIL